MKCSKCGADGAGKFCHECGGAMASAEMKKSACPACSTEQLGGKFCSACASPMTDNSAAEIDAAMSAIDTLAKSAAVLAEDIAFVPSAETRAAAASVPAGDPEPAADEGEGEGEPLIKALLESHNFLVDGQSTLGKETRATRKELGILAKAHLGIYGMLKSLTEKVDALSGARVGRKTQVVLNERRSAGGGEMDPETDPNDLKGLDLVAKACTAAGLRDKDGEPLLLAGEVARVEQWAHANGTLKSIGAQDSALGHRLNRAFAELTRQAH